MSDDILKAFALARLRMFNSPVAMHEDATGALRSILDPRPVHTAQISALRASAENRRPPAPRAARRSISADRGYDVLGRGVAVIPVQGMLMHHFYSPRPVAGITGYLGIRAALNNALNDRGVRAIALDIDSLGGEIPGCFDMVDGIYHARGSKPIHAILTENACSAAYAIASAADRVIVPRTGLAGGVGILAMILDCSKDLSKAGIKMNVIQFGARKTDGHPEVPLSEGGRARFQAEVDTIGRLFVETVARNRGLKTGAVRALEGRALLGGSAVKAGLADLVAPPDAALQELLAWAGRDGRKVLAR